MRPRRTHENWNGEAVPRKYVAAKLGRGLHGLDPAIGNDQAADGKYPDRGSLWANEVQSLHGDVGSQSVDEEGNEAAVDGRQVAVLVTVTSVDGRQVAVLVTVTRDHDF